MEVGGHSATVLATPLISGLVKEVSACISIQRGADHPLVRDEGIRSLKVCKWSVLELHQL